MLDYLHAHPAVITILAGLLPSVVALMLGRWQSRSALEARRLELRHSISAEWLAEFNAAATRYQRCLDRLRSSPGRRAGINEACDAHLALQKAVGDLMEVCAVMIYSFPRHWLAGVLAECVLQLNGICGQLTRRLSRALREAVRAEEGGPVESGADIDMATVEAVPQPLVPPEEMAALLGTFAMLCSLANCAVEARLMQNRFTLRRWHLRGDLRTVKSWAERLTSSTEGNG